MTNIRRFSRYISINPAVCHGRPVFKGTRIPITTALDYLAAGMTIEDILRGFPPLNRRAIRAAIQFAAQRLKDDEFTPLAQAS